MAKRAKFAITMYEEFTIKKDGKTYGTLRIKPSGILWCPKHGKLWWRVKLDDFATYAEAHGKKVRQ